MLVVAAVFVLSSLLDSMAYADRAAVKRLSSRLKSARSAKARISAAVALAKLKDKRGTPALVRALGDRAASVRAMAATALGHLGDKKALPALKRALDDDDDMVRRRAEAAIKRLKKSAKSRPSNRKAKRRSRLSRVRVDAKESPKQTSDEPPIYVAVKSAADKSRGRVKRRTRKRRARKLKRLMLAAMRTSSRVTTKPREATRLGLETVHVDASIVKLKRRTRGKWVEVECEIRLAISNERGKMISFLTGGAKVQVAKKTYRRRNLREMRADAIASAVKNVYDDLLSFLDEREQS